MLILLWLAIVVLCGYGVYRTIRGGFRRSQSERLTGYGILGCIVLLLVAAKLVTVFQ